MGLALTTYGDDLCNTRLGLGLSTSHEQNKIKVTKNKKHEEDQDDRDQFLFPSLKLGLLPHSISSSVVNKEINNNYNYDQLISTCGENIKNEEMEFNKVMLLSSKASIDEEKDHEGSPRKKLRLTKQQSSILEDNFNEHVTLNPKRKQALAEQLKLRPRQIEVWFQNRRARTKLKQSEAERELLRKCCKTLKEENKRLQKELQELKSLKLAGPQACFTHIADATIFSMCPSCGRISDRSIINTSSTSSSAFKVVTKPHDDKFYGARS